MAGISGAHHRKRSRLTGFDQTRIEARHLGRATHVEIQIAAPKLLDALDGLAGLEPSLDDFEVMALIAAGAFGDLVDDRRQVGMEHAKPDYVGVGGTQNARARDPRHSRCQKIPATDHRLLPGHAHQSVRGHVAVTRSLRFPRRRMMSVKSLRNALACAELRSRGRSISTVTYCPIRPGDGVMIAIRSAR